MRKICAKMVPKLLSDEYKECRKELCLDLLQRIENKPDLLNSTVTCDETWVFMYDMEPSENPCSGSQHYLQDQKKHTSCSKFKAMLTVSYDIQGIVMAEWVPSYQTVNQQHYIEILTKLRERVRRKRPELWRNWWILHPDNVPAHNTSSVKQFLVNL